MSPIFPKRPWLFRAVKAVEAVGPFRAFVPLWLLGQLRKDKTHSVHFWNRWMADVEGQSQSLAGLQSATPHRADGPVQREGNTTEVRAPAASCWLCAQMCAVDPFSPQK